MVLGEYEIDEVLIKLVGVDLQIGYFVLLYSFDCGFAEEGELEFGFDKGDLKFNVFFINGCFFIVEDIILFKVMNIVSIIIYLDFKCLIDVTDLG